MEVANMSHMFFSMATMKRNQILKIMKMGWVSVFAKLTLNFYWKFSFWGIALMIDHHKNPPYIITEERPLTGTNKAEKYDPIMNLYLKSLCIGAASISNQHALVEDRNRW